MRYILFCLVLILGLSFSHKSATGEFTGYVIKLNAPVKSNLAGQISSKINQPESDIRLESIFRFDHIYRLEVVQPKMESSKIKQALLQIQDIQMVEEDAAVELRDRPNDPQFDSQTNMEVIQAPEIWDFTSGGNTVLDHDIVIAVIDEGFEIDHEDLAGNIWVNRDEIAGNGIDDDANGYIDDVFGGNLRTKDGIHLAKRHGTAVAGIIGAVGNNQIGVAGVNWNIRMMLLSEPDRVSRVIEAYEYVLEQRMLWNQTNGVRGAFVVATNFSLGVKERFADEFPIWCGIYNSLGQQGVLNVSATSNDDVDIDVVGDMPSLCSSEYLIVVSNTDVDDRKVESGRSPVNVDLSAPGDGTYTLDLNDAYGGFGGTSASSPHVAGAISLIYSLPCEALAEAAVNSPASTALAVKDAILNGVDLLPELTNVTRSGGRLNLFNSSLALETICEGGTGPLDIVNIYPSPARESVKIVYETPNFKEYEVQIFDALGRIVHMESISPPIFGEKFVVIPLDRFTSGIYFVAIMNNDLREVSSFAVE